MSRAVVLHSAAKGAVSLKGDTSSALQNVISAMVLLLFVLPVHARPFLIYNALATLTSPRLALVMCHTSGDLGSYNYRDSQLS
jgi:hypothetical protein